MNDVVAYLLTDMVGNQVVVGPLLWQPSDGLDSKQWYFVIATGAPEGFRCTRIETPPDIRDEIRSGVFQAFVGSPTVVHDVGDEPYMAKLCELLWPCERARLLREAVDAEYAAR